MKLGNIVSQHELRDYAQFNLFKKLDEIDNDLPTLVVGFTNVKKYFPEFDVEKRQIDEKTFWTLSIREKSPFWAVRHSCPLPLPPSLPKFSATA